MDLASLILGALQIWGWIGAAVATVFLLWGIDQVDEDAHGAYFFRLLLVPGILLLWPLVLRRWWQIRAQSDPWAPRYRPVRKSHALAVVLMCAAMALILILGLSARQSWPEHIAPVELAEAEG